MNLKSKSVLVLDHGLFLSFALKMAEGFGRVLYYNDWRRGRPSFHEITVGKGYDGIEVVKDMFDVIDSVDIVACPDVLGGDMQKWLRGRGYKVWGSGKGEDIELYRIFSKEVIKSVGLPVGKYQVVAGVPALRELLQKVDDRYIKISFLRGLMESWHHETYWLSKPRLDELEFKLGPLAEDQEFIVENPIESDIEVGYDGLFVGRFPKMAINGVEIKDCGYVGVVQEYAKMPKEITRTNNALAAVLAGYGYANFWSTEIRLAKDGTPYLIDPCCRQGSPSGESQLAIWGNLPEVVWAGAHGELVEPEPSAKYVAQAMIYNAGDEDHWSGISIPPEVRDSVNLYFGMRKGEEDYVVPQMNAFDEMGSVICTGDTADKAIEGCKEMADQLKGNITVKVESLEKALDEFESMADRKMNVEPAAV